MFIRRIGIFIMIVGGIILLVSMVAGKPNSQSMFLFCIGVPMILLGGTLWYRNRERTPSQRFRILRKFSAKDNDKDDEAQ